MTPHERIETGNTFFGKTFRPMRDIAEILLLLCATKTPIIMSFIDERVQPTGLTFDDVLLVPAPLPEVLPREVNVTSRFSRNIKLNIPIVSAAMDTVTEAAYGDRDRSCRRHRCHPQEYVHRRAGQRQVRKVKRAENGMIYDPITIAKENTVGDALALMQENKIGGIPVVDAEQHPDRDRYQPRPALPARHAPPDFER